MRAKSSNCLSVLILAGTRLDNRMGKILRHHLQIARIESNRPDPRDEMYREITGLLRGRLLELYEGKP
jgi:hypothetical protein